jgi:uncharacterized protein YbjT (DUF2867 family)
MLGESNELNVVTGAFGYTGKYIAQNLLSMQKRVKTLTRRPLSDNPFGNSISIAPLNFRDPNELVKSLCGATTLYNTYWIRFPYGKATFEEAITNTKTLITAAKEAGIQRIVHISVTNASTASPLPYFRAKGMVEEAIISSRISYAIIRPTVIFGTEDILINNIAWFLRRFPIFVVSGSGNYNLQPIYVEDVANAAITASYQSENIIWDVCGPETYTFNALVGLIAEKIGGKAKVIHLQPRLSLLFAKLLGYLLRDVVLTRDEMNGLMSDMLVSNNYRVGQTRFVEWLEANANIIGIKYESELKRHYPKGLR